MRRTPPWAGATAAGAVTTTTTAAATMTAVATNASLGDSNARLATIFGAVIVAVVVDLLVLRTGLLRTKAFWATEAIVVFFQFIVNGVLTGLGIVQYDPRVIIGLRLAYAPVEDLGFGFAMVTTTIALWRRAGSAPGER